ncbi:MAG: hypothetical protein MJ094_05010 [Saccharofermentans sp.]|nr:hypothetical protein [Saccharofermentans sp.]
MINFKKSLSIVMTVAVIFTATGCSDFLEGIASRKAIDALDSTLADFISDPASVVNVDDLDDNQLAIALDGFSDVTYSIDEDVKMNSSRDKVTVDVTFENVRVLNDIPVGTEEEVAEYIENASTNDVEVSYTLKRNESKWEVVDEPDYYSIFFEPYSRIAYIDENGMPTAFNQEFFDECVVAAVYYDPVMGNPLDRASISSPVAIQMVVYFDRLMYLPFTAELVKNGSVVQTIDVIVDNQSIANCDFSGQAYTPGTYTVNVYFDGGIVASEDITVAN